MCNDRQVYSAYKSHHQVLHYYNPVIFSYTTVCNNHPTLTDQSESRVDQGWSWTYLYNVSYLFQVWILWATFCRWRLFRDLVRQPSVRSHLLWSRSSERPRELHEDHAENRRHSGHAYWRSGEGKKVFLIFCRSKNVKKIHYCLFYCFYTKIIKHLKAFFLRKQVGI